MPDTTTDVDHVLQVGVDRALAHLRAGRDLDARMALEVAVMAADLVLEIDAP